MSKKMMAFLVTVLTSIMLVACGSKETEEVVPVEIPAIESVTEEVNDATDTSVDEKVAETEEEASETVQETTMEESDDGIDWADITEYDAPKLQYVQDDVKVRKGPGTSFDSLGELKLNEEVKVLGKSKSSPWVLIEYKGEKAFSYGTYFGDEKVDLEARAAAEEAKKAQAEADAKAAAIAAQNAAQVPPQPEIAAPAGVLFIGDSRTCQMKAASGGGGCSWICEYATKYDWFENTAIPQADKIVGKGTKVVICMGVNDPGNCNNYASLANRKAAEWAARGAAVYYVSLNPVSTPYEDKQPAIDAFNGSMPGLLGGVRWIDTASTVKQGGYVLADGIHYDGPSNAAIFGMIMRNLR